MKNISVMEKDNGSEVDLNQGDDLTARLECNPSTGHLWLVAKNDDRVLGPQGNPAYEPASTIMTPKAWKL